MKIVFLFFALIVTFELYPDENRPRNIWTEEELKEIIEIERPAIEEELERFYNTGFFERIKNDYYRLQNIDIPREKSYKYDDETIDNIIESYHRLLEIDIPEEFDILQNYGIKNGFKKNSFINVS